MTKIRGFADTIKWYDQHAKEYVKASKNLSVTLFIDKFVSLLRPSGSILDAGCGSGRDSASLKNKGFTVTGIDISEGLIREARKDYPSIEFIVGNILDLPFPENNFDGVWAQASLVHLETERDARKAINELNRVTKPGGILHLLVKEKLTLKSTEVVSDKISNHDRFFRYYSPNQIKQTLEDEGFEILFIQNNVADPADRPATKWIWALAKKPLIAN